MPLHQTLRAISTSRRRALALVIACAALGACDGSDPAPPPAPPVPVEAPAAPAAAVDAIEGWDCDSAERCFGWHVGLVREYERSVGAARTRESWRIDDAERREDTAELRQSGGNVSRYLWRPDALVMTIRDAPLEMLRFPLDARPLSFEVDDATGGAVRMYIEPLTEPVITPAGSFSPCVRHEARFVNEDTPGQVRLRIETHLCKGVGEVTQRVILDGMPNAVERVLTRLTPAGPAS